MEKIYLELKKLNFNFSYYGTKYIMESIYIIYFLKNSEDLNLKREIFPVLSKRYHKSIDTIHSDMKKAINNMYYDCDENILKSYFNYYELKKPTLKEIILKVNEKLS